MWSGEVPFYENGNLAHYPEPWRGIVWKKSFVFKDTMRITSIRRGRSAAYFLAVSESSGKEYTAFMVDILEMIAHGIEPGGVINGEFGFVKRGQNYGICLAEGGGE